MNNHEVWIFEAVRELEAAEHLHLGGFWLQSMRSSRKAVEMLGVGVLLFVGVGYNEIKSIGDNPFAISRKIEALGLHKFSAAVIGETTGMQRLEMYSWMDGHRDEPPYLMFDRESSARSLECARRYRGMAMHVMSKRLAGRHG